jgi:hypothetical protein
MRQSELRRQPREFRCDLAESEGFAFWVRQRAASITSSERNRCRAIFMKVGQCPEVDFSRLQRTCGSVSLILAPPLRLGPISFVVRWEGPTTLFRTLRRNLLGAKFKQ